MCGIGGYIGNPRGVDASALLLALAPRGPDGEGLLLASGAQWSATLVHRRLAILDPTPAAAQPMEDGADHALVFNGEIFNHAELRRALQEQDGLVFHSTGDTEVVLKGLVLHGPAFLSRMRGPFALALLNRRHGTLLLARDRLGVNPLYVSELPGGLAFASTVAALERARLTSGELDVRGLCSLLFFGSVAEPHTLTLGVRELPPGTWAFRHVDGSLEEARYWRIPGENAGLTHAEAVESVRAALHSAVAAELVSDVPVAVLLSSGLDSSAVAALAARAGGAHVDAFTVGFPSSGAAVDESALAAETAHALGLRHHVVHADVSSGGRALLEALDAQDLPSSDGINTHLVSGAIRQAGYKVALSGLGGDELFLGYANRANFHRLARLPSLDRGARLSRAAASVARGLGLSVKLERAVSSAFPPRGAPGAYAAVRTLMGPASVLAHLHPDLRSRLEPRDLDPLTYLDASPLTADVDGALSRLELRNYLRSTLLKDANTLSLAHGVELRVPMMDHRLVETVMSIPGRLRGQGDPPKPLLRAALAGVLPEGIHRRPKVGFVLPLGEWLDAAEPTHPHDAPVVAAPAGSPLPVRLVSAALGRWWLRRGARFGA
jgi:asparagine synthase (glutamine-hydrolysing)